MKTYKPTDMDVAWVKSLVKITANNAVWGWPDTGLIYRFDHQNKTLTLLNPELMTDEHANEGHQRTIQVFKVIDYTVKVLDK